MTRIPEHDQDIFEQVLYLPMLLSILKRDRMTFNQSPFKLKKPYLVMIEGTMKKVQKDLKEARD
ncbi:hypothetical protein ACN6MY_12130 [Peribacillus sp. B-H-3]|uniref:hypothetical protein n=1 Tax=Peribacillus sp. B-H-3 TaxID=3400420 RepID=UPI003B0293BB